MMAATDEHHDDLVLVAVGEERPQPGFFVGGHRLRQHAVHQVRQRTGCGYGREKAKHQEDARGNLTAAAT